MKIAQNIGSGMTTVETITWKQKLNKFKLWIGYKNDYASIRAHLSIWLQIQDESIDLTDTSWFRVGIEYCDKLWSIKSWYSSQLTNETGRISYLIDRGMF